MALGLDQTRSTAKPVVDPRLAAIRANAKAITTDEGHDKAYDQTFGKGKWQISVNGGDTYDFSDGSGTSFGVYSGSGHSVDGSDPETEDLLDFQEFAEALERAGGGDGNLGTIGDAHSDWDDFDTSYTYTPYRPIQYSYDGSLDVSDPATRDRVMNSKMVFDDFGSPSYFDDGTSCSAPTGDKATLFSAAKRSLEAQPLDLTNTATLSMVQSARVDPETGSVITDTMCASPEYGQKILEAKATLDGTGPSASAIANATPKAAGGHADVIDQVLPLSSKAGIEVPGASGAQGNDIFIATKGLEDRGYFAAKPAAPQVSSIDSPGKTGTDPVVDTSIIDGIALSQKSNPEYKPAVPTNTAAPAPIV